MWYRLTAYADITDIEEYLSAFSDLEGGEWCVWSQQEREILLSKYAHKLKVYKKILAIINEVCNINLLGSAKYHILVRWTNDSSIFHVWSNMGKTDIELVSYPRAKHEFAQILKEIQYEA